MRKFRLATILALVGVICCGAFCMTGCGGKGKGDELKIVVAGCYQNNWEKVFMNDKIVSEFEKETGIRVSMDIISASDAIKKIKTEQESGEYISDLAIVHSGEMPTFTMRGYVQDITADVAFTDRTIDKDKQFTGVTEVNGAKYFVPVSTDTYMVVANKKAMDYLPTGADKNNLTWEQFSEWASNIKNGANGHNGVGAKTMFPAQTGGNLIYIMGSMGLSYGADFVDVDSNDMKKAYEVMFEMAENEVFVNEQKNYLTAVEKMKDETAWLSFQHMSPAGEIQRFRPDGFEILPPPRGDEGCGSVIGAWGMGILNNAPHRAAAVKFVEYMTRKDVSYKYCTGLGGIISTVDEVIQQVKELPVTGMTTSEKIMMMGIDVMANGCVKSVPSADYSDWNAVKGVYETMFDKIMLKSRQQYLDQIPIAASQIKGLLKDFPQEGM